ncbi:MAG: peptidylprolyl isomerase [Oscillospiraceae bacterium]|nr:peptidylprolyl isomerase [Oscillospiraceae bacterium]
MKRAAGFFILLLVPIFLFGACGKSASDPPGLASRELQLQNPVSGDTIAVFDTSLGVFKAVLYPQYAPNAVNNFVTHSKNGYYNGTTFHRVIADFIIQGGDPTNTGSGGDSISMLPFEDEFDENLHNYRGALAMVNTGKNTNKSQFFIVKGGDISDEMINKMKSAGYPQSVIDAYREVGGRPTMDYVYTVFGQVYDGLDVIDAINAVKTRDDNRPFEDVVVNSIVIDTYRNPVS